MYYYLMGTLAKLDLTFAVIDCGGVGYKLTVSGTTFSVSGSTYSPVCFFDARAAKIEIAAALTLIGQMRYRDLCTHCGSRDGLCCGRHIGCCGSSALYCGCGRQL